MPLETGTTIADLNALWPVGATDPKSQGDDHLRLIKAVLKSTFENLDDQTLETILQAYVPDLPLQEDGKAFLRQFETGDAVPKWVEASGALISEFHDATRVGSWRIIGETLECWGFQPNRGNNDPFTLALPKTYDGNFTFTATVGNDGTGSKNRFVSTDETLTGNQVTGIMVWTATNAQDSRGFHWHTIGKWDGVS